MTRADIFREVERALAEEAVRQNVRDVENRYYKPTPDRGRKEMKDNYLYLFCENVADRQYMANIVMFYNKEHGAGVILKRLLRDFSVSYTTATYCGKNARSLYEDVLGELPEELKKRWTKQKKNKAGHYFSEAKWMEYCSAICRCAVYLSGNAGIEPVERLIAPAGEDDLMRRIYSVRCLKNYISPWDDKTGVGFAMCCNWLKECGAEWLSKPDMHVTRVTAEMLRKEHGYDPEHQLTEDKVIQLHLKALGTRALRFNIPGNNSRLSKEEYPVVYMYRWAKELGITPFRLDRMLYIYCTGGRFYAEENDISEKHLLGLIAQEYAPE